MSAMLASAMPEVRFADPLGPAGPLTSGLPGPPEAPVFDPDISAPNGSEPAPNGSEPAS
jgi:hypothetical protein